MQHVQSGNTQEVWDHWAGAGATTAWWIKLRFTREGHSTQKKAFGLECGGRHTQSPVRWDLKLGQKGQGVTAEPKEGPSAEGLHVRPGWVCPSPVGSGESPQGGSRKVTPLDLLAIRMVGHRRLSLEKGLRRFLQHFMTRILQQSAHPTTSSQTQLADTLSLTRVVFLKHRELDEEEGETSSFWGATTPTLPL